MTTRVVIIAGPSGVGKSALVKKLQEDFPLRIGRSVSHTTRQPRTGELNGVDYHFVTHAQFESLVEQNEFVEHALVHGERYGTTFKAVNSVTQELLILVIDVHGCRTLRSLDFEALFVFIAPPDTAALTRRLEQRNTDNEAAIQTRLLTARGEMDTLDEEGLWDGVLINDDFDACYHRLANYVRLE